MNQNSTNAEKSNFLGDFKDLNPKERLFRHQRHLAANKCEDIFWEILLYGKSIITFPYFCHEDQFHLA